MGRESATTIHAPRRAALAALALSGCIGSAAPAHAGPARADRMPVATPEVGDRIALAPREPHIDDGMVKGPPAPRAAGPVASRAPAVGEPNRPAAARPFATDDFPGAGQALGGWPAP